jgi:two-component system sensor histidine kinase ChiS
MTNNKILNTGIGNLNRTAIWIFLESKWHFVFWPLYLIYCYTTDQIMYGKFYYFSKELLLVITHPLFLFYAFVFFLNRFSVKSPLKILTTTFIFLGVTTAFFALRFTLNYIIFPIMDQARGFAKENLILKQELVMGSLWMWEFFVKALAYYFIINFIKKQQQLRKADQINFEQQKVLQAKEIEEERARQVEANYKTLEMTFANLVHETKTPLTLINNCLAEHLEKYGTSYELDLVKISLSKLDKDITNLFDLQRLKNNKEIYDHTQNCDVSTILEDNLKMFEYYTKRRKISLKHSITPGLYSLADPAAVNRIISNLIENAIKYSLGDTILSVNLLDAQGRIILQVSDRGIGMSDDEIATVFTPYVQLNKIKKNVQGMGLGLPLVKSILDNLHGSITIQSNSSKGELGTTVIVELNKLPSMDSTIHYNVQNQDFLLEEEIFLTDFKIDEKSAHLLVVEDNRGLNGYLTRKLGQSFNVRYATNGIEAMDRIKERIPDLIITDIMMDDMDGFELAGLISKNSNFNHVPIIFLSAKNTEKDKLFGMSLGAVDYVEKPFSYNVLLSKIESILSIQNRRDMQLFRTMKEFGKNMLYKEEENTSGNFETNCRKFKLTPTEIEIAKALIEGKTLKLIAESRHISEHTVETHRKNIYDKLSVNTKHNLIKKLTS